MESFRVYGVTVGSCAPLRLPVAPNQLAPDVVFAVQTAPPAPDFFSDSSEWRLRDVPVAVPGLGSRALFLRVTSEGVVVRVTDVAHLQIGRDRIDCWFLSPEFEQAVDLVFQAWALPMWLELQGRPVLHGGAIQSPSGAIAFLADSGTGKSTLIASFAASAYPIMTDDLVVPVWDGEYLRVWPGASEVRIHPDAVPVIFTEAAWRARAIHPLIDKHAVTVPGGPDPLGCPLAAIYVLDRLPNGDRGTVTVHDLTGHVALAALVRATYSPRFVRGAGLERARMVGLTRMVASVPVRRLQYPSGLDRLPEVHAAVMGRAAAPSP